MGIENTKTAKEYQDIVNRPGKFEGESIYTPYFWDILIDCGNGDDTEYDINENPIEVFNINDEDIAIFPELKQYKQFRIWTDNNGFVYGELS